MTRLLFVALLAFQASAFAKSPASAEKKESAFKNMSVTQLADALKSNKEEVHVYDANTDDIRKKEGIIPGATKLASITSYETQVLPTDKSAKLVFYCANTMCTASHSAAKRAIAAGYKNVSVLNEGIQGWKKAGQQTEKVN
jgi:rhodanese-related sulfurtransferase